MPTSQTGTRGSRLEEVVTGATTDAVNAALAERGLDASAIVAILVVPGTMLADGPGETFRVLYRT
jgi:hypothetical protein